MGKLKHFRLWIMFIAVGLFSNVNIMAQTFKVDNQNSTLTILGTSSLHDWEITAEQQEGSIKVESSENFAILDLVMSFDVEKLSSGKSGMDKNTRKALNYKNYPTIDFKLKSIKSITKNSTGYDVVVLGNLTIAGTTKTIQLDFDLVQSNNSIKLTGEKALKMTTFNVEPPTALLGTITTGDDITIKFNTIFK